MQPHVCILDSLSTRGTVGWPACSQGTAEGKEKLSLSPAAKLFVHPATGSLFLALPHCDFFELITGLGAPHYHWCWFILMDSDADALTPSSNTRSYTLRSVPSSPGRSFFILHFPLGRCLDATHQWQNDSEMILCNVLDKMCESRMAILSEILWKHKRRWGCNKSKCWARNVILTNLGRLKLIRFMFGNCDSF